jgi:hypothetical protein
MNGAVKIRSRVMNNFKNPAKTLAYRRQSTALHHLLENEFHQQSVTNGAISVQPVDLTLYDFDEILFSASTYTNEVYFPVSTKVIINETEYKKGVFVIMGRNENGDLVFGEILFFCISPKDPLFVMIQITLI